MTISPTALRLPIIFASTLLLQACASHIVTTQETIPAPKLKVMEASLQVANQLSMEAVAGSLRNASIFYAQGWGWMQENENLAKADMFVTQRKNYSSTNYKVIGALQFTGGLSETECTSLFTSVTADPYAWSKLYPALIGQQLALTEKRQMPYANPHKDAASFVALNLLSPVAGTKYLDRGNPLLIEETTMKNMYIPYAAADAVAAGCLVGAVAAKRHDAKTIFLNAGISLAVVTRLLSMLNLLDLSEYNDLARTPYNLGIIRK